LIQKVRGTTPATLEGDQKTESLSDGSISGARGRPRKQYCELAQPRRPKKVIWNLALTLGDSSETNDVCRLLADTIFAHTIQL